jgi:pimeloyl-ACP methyl ester carboxylesterase
VLRSFAGGTLFGEQVGEAKPEVIALHGWQRSSKDYDEVLALLKGHSALALDLPGFGNSPAPPEPWGTAEYAASLLPVLDEVADRPVVVGHSFGALVALRLGVAHPEKVRALVLTGAPFFRPDGAQKPARTYRLMRRLARAGVVSDARLEQMRKRHGSTDYRQSSGVMRDVLVRRLNESYEDDVKRVSVPVQLVWGELDSAAPLEVAQRALVMMPHASLTVIEGIGHLVPTERPAELAQAIEAALG